MIGALSMLAALPLAVAAPQADAVDLLGQVSIEQHLGRELPTELVFRDSDGRELELADLLGDEPLVLAMIYYECPMLCNLIMDGLHRALKPLAFDVGDQFDVVAVSIDPGEDPALATTKKEQAALRYAREGTDEGWHFLTGEEPAIAELADALGFRYAYDPETDEYAHASGIFVITPEGKIAKVFYGVEYSTRDLRLALVEASNEEIGSLSDAVLLWCYGYDPTTGRYGFAIMRVIQVLGVLTVGVLGTFVWRNL